ncbi:hypothetical protein [Evansella clarkii]|uniref:hypothetical protein n=1 Tax=Evansella clarkii TaxID=79879 RepID=UPI00142F87E5|nr:hypothetical protein [Evansella clarkii]
MERNEAVAESPPGLIEANVCMIRKNEAGLNIWKSRKSGFKNKAMKEIYRD